MNDQFAPGLYDRIQAMGGLAAYNDYRNQQITNTQMQDEQLRHLQLQNQQLYQTTNQAGWAQREADHDPYKGMSYEQMATDPHSPAYDQPQGQYGVQVSFGNYGDQAPLAPYMKPPALQPDSYGPPQLITGDRQDAMRKQMYRGTGAVTDTPEGKAARAELDYYEGQIKALGERFDLPKDEKQKQIAEFQRKSSEVVARLSSGASAAPAPAPNPAPTDTRPKAGGVQRPVPSPTPAPGPASTASIDPSRMTLAQLNALDKTTLTPAQKAAARDRWNVLTSGR